jgi:ribulose-phosphate 3-epimerase
MTKIIPSIASANQIFLAKELQRLGDQYENLHIDIEDGNFVPNITFGLRTIKKLREASSKPFSVHLMVTNPEDYFVDLASLNCSHIFIHVENAMYLLKMINTIKKLGIKAGLALNPISNISDFEYLLPDIDAVLYMSSEPDTYGDIINLRVIDKIMQKKELEYEIWVDGGIKIEHLPLLSEKNVDYAVMGRDLFNNNPAAILNQFN